jgi:formate dehydrogenase subunit gamma
MDSLNQGRNPDEVMMWDPKRALLRIREYTHLRGPLLPVLHAVQEEFGYIDEAAVPLIAEELNISKAEVHGVISFYHDFRHHRVGKHVIKVCRAESCQSMGCEALVGHLENRLGVKLGETTPDERFTLEQVFCLGNCALSPAVMINGQPYGRVSAARADALIEAARRPQ